MNENTENMCILLAFVSPLRNSGNSGANNKINDFRTKSSLKQKMLVDFLIKNLVSTYGKICFRNSANPKLKYFFAISEKKNSNKNNGIYCFQRKPSIAFINFLVETLMKRFCPVITDKKI